eukprot:5404309-Amphidinium_carterae.1
MSVLASDHLRYLASLLWNIDPGPKQREAAHVLELAATERTRAKPGITIRNTNFGKDATTRTDYTSSSRRNRN